MKGGRRGQEPKQGPLEVCEERGGSRVFKQVELRGIIIIIAEYCVIHCLQRGENNKGSYRKRVKCSGNLWVELEPKIIIYHSWSGMLFKKSNVTCQMRQSALPGNINSVSEYFRTLSIILKEIFNMFNSHTTTLISHQV